MAKRLNSGWIFASLVFLLASCCRSNPALSPRPIPSEALKEAFQTARSNPLISADDVLREDWWELFNDPQLSALIAQAFASNPTLHSARASALFAAYQAAVVRANLFPNIGWGGDLLREKFSETGLIPFTNPSSTAPSGPPLPATGGASGIPVYFTQYETEATLNYNLDIWGKNRRAWEAALGDARARNAEAKYTRLLIGISLGQLYYQLQTGYLRLKIAEALVKNRDHYVQITRRRYEEGLARLIDFRRAEADLSAANARLLEMQADISRNENALKAYLAGDFRENIFDIEIARQPLPKVALPKDLPLHLIAYRPDITAQLWLIESAGKEIAVAKAGFYPDVNLTGLYGYQTLHLHKLFTWPSTFFNILPAFTLPIFDGGRLKANLRSSEVNYDLAILRYDELILNAAQEILTTLEVLNKTEQQLEQYRKQLNDQEEVLKLTKLRKDYHLDSNLDVLTNEYSLLIAQDQEASALGSTLSVILSLIKALGGGYKV